MHNPRQVERPAAERFGLNPLLQVFLTIIAGAAVAVIAWAVIQRFLHIITLLIASLLIAYLLDPLVGRMERGGVRRPLAILIVYILIFGVVIVGGILLLSPLTQQLTALAQKLPSLLNAQSLGHTPLDPLLRRFGATIPVERLRSHLTGYITNAGTSLLDSTLVVVTGIVNTVTDLLLVLAITFYLLLDGHAMHNRAIRLLPASYRERWFFIEATLNKVLGGYIRGQMIVAATVGVAAGIGCWVLHVQYPIVIGLLAFLFELIPMIGPVLGMIPAVLIALFQSPLLAVWVFVYFVVLQQLESNLIVPRVSGHAVGLHPLAALLALLVGVELGGVGGALLSVPLAGVLWVIIMALYADATGQEQLLAPRQRRSVYVSLARQAFGRKRGPEPVQTGDHPVPVTNERLATIKQEQEHLIEQFEADQAKQVTAEHVNGDGKAPEKHRRGPDDPELPPAF